MTACEMLACRLEVDQLEERNTGSVEVDGSIPSSSTNILSHLNAELCVVTSEEG